MKIHHLVLVLLIGVVAGGFGGFAAYRLMTPPAPAAQAPAAQAPAAVPARSGNLQEEFAAVAEYATPGVVLITAKKKIGVYSGVDFYRGRRKIDYYDVPSGQGSGFFIRKEGVVLTNYHVVRDQDVFVVSTSDGAEFPARVIGVDPPSDLAVLRLELKSKREFRVLKFADPATVKIGHWSIAIGSPLGLKRTVTVGIVSSKKRSGVGVNMYENYVQTDASINPGNSGGPLLNLRGEVIGVNDFIMSPSGGNIGLSFAISAEIAARAADEMIRTGHVERPWLGALLSELTPEILKQLGLDHGVGIANVFRDSPAAAVLERGDVVLEADGVKLTSPHDLRNRVFGAAPGQTLRLKLRRDGRELTVQLKLRRSPRNWFRQSPREDMLPVRGI